MKLLELAELLQKVEAGINHKCSFYVRLLGDNIFYRGIQFDVYFTRTTDREQFEVHECFSSERLATYPDELLIRDFTGAVNQFIRRQYESGGKEGRCDQPCKQ